jgi:hypothetical protein
MIGNRFRMKNRIHRMAGAHPYERVTIGRGLSDEIAGEYTVGTGPVFDDERLSQRFPRALRDQARRNIDSAAGSEAYDDSNRLAGKLRLGRRRTDAARLLRNHVERACAE